MRRVFSGGIKGIGALVVFWFGYVNDTFSPLFWLLCGLVFIDLVLNVHKEGQQFQKLGSAAVTMGIPGLISSSIGQPGFARILVAMMCLVYIQHVVPQLGAAIGKIRFSKDPVQNVIDETAAQKILELLAQKEQQTAQQIVDSAKQVGTSGTAGGAS